MCFIVWLCWIFNGSILKPLCYCCVLLLCLVEFVCVVVGIWCTYWIYLMIRVNLLRWWSERVGWITCVFSVDILAVSDVVIGLGMMFLCILDGSWYRLNYWCSFSDLLTCHVYVCVVDLSTCSPLTYWLFIWWIVMVCYVVVVCRCCVACQCVPGWSLGSYIVMCVDLLCRCVARVVGMFYAV